MNPKGARFDAWFFVGVAAGFLGAALGIGGGLVMTPALALGAGLEVRVASGTSLSVMPYLAAAAVLTELVLRPELIHPLLALFLSVGAIVGSRVGYAITTRVGDRALRLAFALFLVLAALKVGRFVEIPIASEALPSPAFLGVGFACGVLAALFGVGGGILAVPALLALAGLGSFLEARATSLVMVLVVSCTSTLLFRRGGHVDKPRLRALLPGAIAGAIAGVPVAYCLPEQALRWAFAALLVWSSVRLFLATRRRPA